MNTLFQADQTWILWAILLGIAALSIYLEEKYAWAQKITGAIIGLIGAAILTNLKIIPMESPVYDTVWEYVIPLSIPMLLFKSNMKRILTESGSMIIAFIFGALGTMAGAAAGFFLLKNYIPELNKIAGMMTGSYMGGGVNFVALASIFDIDETLVSATTVADNFNMAIYFLILLGIAQSAFFRHHFKHPHIDRVEANEMEAVERDVIGKPVTTKDVASVFAVATIIVAISIEIANFFAGIIPTENAFLNILNQLLGNSFLIITTLTMVLATVFPTFFENLNAAESVGNFLIYIFFVVIGVPASISMIIKTAPLLLIFCLIMVVFNMIFPFVGAKIFKLSLEESIVASNGNIGGPSTAAAMAISQKWNDLIGPGIFVGLLGYIVGNYFGTIMGNILG